jgi:hypothetical protein
MSAHALLDLEWHLRIDRPLEYFPRARNVLWMDDIVALPMAQ